MQIHFHAHHAEVSDAMRKRAEREVAKVAQRIPRVVEAIIRFEQDGNVRRVSLTLRAPRHHDLAGSAEGRYFGPALALALARVKKQASKEKAALPKARGRRQARATA